jgi:hypothetical protein
VCVLPRACLVLACRVCPQWHGAGWKALFVPRCCSRTRVCLNAWCRREVSAMVHGGGAAQGHGARCEWLPPSPPHARASSLVPQRCYPRPHDAPPHPPATSLRGLLAAGERPPPPRRVRRGCALLLPLYPVIPWCCPTGLPACVACAWLPPRKPSETVVPFLWGGRLPARRRRRGSPACRRRPAANALLTAAP